MAAHGGKSALRKSICSKLWASFESAPARLAGRSVRYGSPAGGSPTSVGQSGGCQGGRQADMVAAAGKCGGNGGQLISKPGSDFSRVGNIGHGVQGWWQQWLAGRQQQRPWIGGCSCPVARTSCGSVSAVTSMVYSLGRTARCGSLVNILATWETY